MNNSNRADFIYEMICWRQLRRICIFESDLSEKFIGVIDSLQGAKVSLSSYQYFVETCWSWQKNLAKKIERPEYAKYSSLPTNYLWSTRAKKCLLVFNFFFTGDLFVKSIRRISH